MKLVDSEKPGKKAEKEPEVKDESCSEYDDKALQAMYRTVKNNVYENIDEDEHIYSTKKLRKSKHQDNSVPNMIMVAPKQNMAFFSTEKLLETSSLKSSINEGKQAGKHRRRVRSESGENLPIASGEKYPEYSGSSLHYVDGKRRRHKKSNGYPGSGTALVEGSGNALQTSSKMKPSSHSKKKPGIIGVNKKIRDDKEYEQLRDQNLYDKLDMAVRSKSKTGSIPLPHAATTVHKRKKRV